MQLWKLVIPVCLLGLVMHARAEQPASTGDLTDRSAKEEMCKHTICQHNLRITLKKKDGSTFDRTYEVFPGTVQSFGLAIVAGQTLYIEADATHDRLANFRAVDAVTHPEKTLTATLKQTDDGNMLLKITNPFKQALKFDMGMMPLDQERLVKTSSCPVIAGGFSFESWGEPLFQVVLTNARFIDLKGEHVACD
jgi:hypothetical protein